MKKRYTSDPKQASRRNAFANKNFLILLAFLLLGGNRAWAWAPGSAGTYYLRSTGTDNNFKVYSGPNGTGTASQQEYARLDGFTITSGTYTLVFENTNTIIMNGQIFIQASDGTQAHLVMELGTGASANPTLKITGMSRQTNSDQDAVFYIYKNATTTKDQHTITVQGKNPSAGSTEDIPNYVYDFSNNFVIDGDGPVMTVEDASTPQMKVTTAGNRKSYGLFRIQEGTLTMKNVTVQNFATTWANGGVIQVFTNQNNAKVLADIDHCHFKSIASAKEIVLKVQSNGTYNDQPATGLNEGLRDAKFKNCKIEYTFGCDLTYDVSSLSTDFKKTIDTQNGTFRSIGQNSVTISLENCHLTNNYGCPVRWHGSRSKDKLIVDHCKIENNYTLTGSNVNGGGGLLLKGPAQISQCTIQYNRTNGDGGGIYLSTYTDFGNGTQNLVPDHSILELDGQTLIDNNTAAGNGGGVAINGLEMNNTTGVPLPNGPNYIWYNPDGEPFKLRFVLGGATISNNKALGGDGGGVWINRYNRVTYFKLECELDKGTISTNQCSRNGGGVAIITTSTVSNPTNMPNTVVPQNVTVTIGREGETTNKISIDNNTAATYGGGMYVEAYPVTYNGTTSMVTTTLYDGTDIKDNIANVDGGGFYVKQGLVTIQGSGNSNKPTIQHNTATTGSGGGLYLFSGIVNMTNALLGGDNTSLGNTANQYGGGLYVNTGSVTMENTTIQYNKAETQSGGGIFVESGDVLINPNENETTSPTKIDHNTANLNGGGLSNRQGKVVIFGSFNGDNTFPVEITNNIATTGSGGGIFCIGDASSPDYDIRMRRVKIQGNKATTGTGTTTIGTSTVSNGCGGGIYLQEGKISIINGKLLENQANVSGGGVYTHSGDIDINPTGEERQPTEITNNTATLNGGGLNTHNGKITVQGNDKDTRILIKNNTASTGSGGGVFCMGGSGGTEYITMRHTDLISNKAQSGGGSAGTGVTAGCGGGMYLQQGKISITDVNIQNNYAKVNGGGINNHSGSIDVDGCFIGSSYSASGDHYYKADAGDDTDRGNKADQSGGGIYTHAGDIGIEDYMETSGSIFREESKVAFNEAAENGGGINTHQGTITVNGKEKDDQIEVAFNKAKRGGGLYANAGTIIAYNAKIHDNTATLHGGGANNHSGNIILYGGMLSNNTAREGHGGGAYTNVGDIDLFQFPSTNMSPDLNNGTKVYNNIAKLNGGAFNNHTGRVDVRHATIYNNTSTLGNGGAIYCEGPHANSNRGLGYTIRLLCSDMVQNKTRGQDGTNAAPTGRGGGIYLKYGSIYAHYSNILNNEATIAGGGLNNHEGNILLYGCDITGNRALELDGGGIFIKSGSITTGPSTERVASPTRAKATTVQKNTAYRNGGGIINLDGDITLNGDLIGGTTTDDGNIAHNGDGGGVYIAQGTINMNGGKIAHNTANNGNGGGVYSGGGQFNIEKRDANPEPIVLFVDVEVKRDGGGQNATVHYHLVDQGKYTSVSNVKHGIYWGTGSTDTRVVYDETSGYTYTQGEVNCQRITIPAVSLSAGTTYKAKAFYEYEYSSTTIRGFSEELEFTTYNTMPTVASGTVSNITKNSAQGSGKIMDNGGSDITARGVAFKKDGDAEFTLSPSTETTEFFTVDLTGLVPNTKYYAKAYATNSSGTSYGNQVEFTTLKNTPDMGNGVVSVTTSIENGVIVARASFTMPAGTTFGTGANDVKAYGFVWSRDDDPELVSDHTIAGTLTTGTTFTATYPGVTPGIAFYVRAYASTIESEVNSNSDITNYSVTAATQCFSPMLDGSPVVRAIEISGITQTSATITCQIYSGYVDGTTQYGVHLENDDTYHASSNYDSGTGTYTVELTGLTAGTTYYLKAYATNDGGAHYSYGNGYNFTALPITQPNVVITSVNNIQKTSADINCEVEAGGGTVNDWGVKYSTNSDMSSAIDVNKPGTTLTGSTFSASLTSLTAHTTYYVQAYATNSAGTHTCQKVSFTTDYDKPTVAMTSVANTASPDGSTPNATANFSVTPSTDHVKTYGVCWSILHNPTRNTSTVSDTYYAEVTNQDVSSAIAPSQTMTQRFANTKYYVRAYASINNPDGSGNLDDIVYSSETSFVTLPAMLTGSASNVGNTSATLGGTINSRDSEGHLVGGHYGVCWGTSASPTASGDHVEYPITTANASAFNYRLAATTNIAYGSTYHYRAYYKSSGGDITYGADATFSPLEHGVTVVADPAAGGAVSVVYNGDGTCTVTATPNEGYTFINWTGGPTNPSTENPYTFTIGTGYALTANFTNTYAVTFSFTDGTVTVDASSVTSGTPVDFTYGTTYVLEAVANSGYHFVSWKIGEDVLSTEESFSYTMNQTAATTITVVFESDSKGRESTSGVGPSAGSASPRPRDIYPAPAREPWDWEEVYSPAASRHPLSEGEDSLAMLREQQSRTLVEPQDIPMIDHNTAERGGGIFMAKNDDPLNRAKLVFAGGSSAGDKGQIILNSATLAGGGIYIDTTAHMQMKGHCEVNGNHVPAGKPGGGIYLAGRLYVGNTGSAASDNGLKVNQNFAMDGFNESSYTSNAATYTTTNKRFLNNVLLARHTYYYAHTTPVGTYDDEAAVITLLSDISGKDGGGNPYSNIGFHVSHGFCPVIATSYAFGGEYALAEDGSSTEFHGNTLDTYESWLYKLMEAVGGGGGGTLGSNSAVFEDTESYIAIHTSTPGDPFHSKYIYLWGCWTHPAVLNDPETGSHMSGQTDFKGHYKITNPDDNEDPTINTTPLNWEIYDAEGLAWFSAYVNGLNAFVTGDIGSGGNHYPYSSDKNPYATAKLMNDIDLSAYYWVPIGSVTQYNGANASSIVAGTIFTDNNDHHFKGTIDGQGRTITGMKCQYVSGIFENGLVGYLDGGTVKNLFIDEAIFVANNHDSKGNYIGGIAGSMEGGATISSVEVRSSIDVSNVVDNKALSYVGGLVGQMKGTGNTIHSSMALPQITGAVDYMGGLVGAINADNRLYNSFSNPKFPDATTSPYYAMNTNKYIGGLVGENNGVVENCYSRLQGSEPTSNGSTSVFGWLAGSNTVTASESSEGGIRFSYIPDGKTVYVKSTTTDYDKAPYGHGTYTATTRESGKYGFKHRDQALALAAGTNTYIDNDHLEGGLMTALNNWVTAKDATTYHPWMRTMASGINDDLPILNFKKEGSKALVTDPLYNVVASKDGYYLEYALDVNDKLTEYATLSSGTPEIYLYDANTQSDGTTHQDITVTNIGTTPEVKLYIHEDVGIKVSGAASSTGLKARVGVTIKNDRADENDPNWHLFSSAILNAPIGLEYHTDDATTIDMSSLSGYTNGTYADNIVNNASKPQHLDNVYGVRQYFDPPQTTWSSTDIGYFPTNTPYGTWRTTPWNSGSNPDPKGFFDLYDYSEPHYHWINYKREGSASYMDHWHMDPEHESMLHYKINYTNATTMPAGKGWLMALSSESMMMTDGTLNTGDKTVNVTRTTDNANTPPNGSYGTYTGYAIAEWRGLNLIGNPYQSYLNFDDFYNDSENTDIIWPTYGTREDGGKAYLYYTVGNSTPYDAYPNIHPHQGFFVKVKESVGNYQLKFKDAMRVAGVVSTDNSPYRSELNYPLVALNCYDANGYYDRIRVEINRPELGGGGKMYSLHSGNAMIYASFEGQDYHTLFAPEGVSEVPVRFEAFEDGNYTMKWETYNGHFSYLHLIDNLTGNDVDCLTTDEYTYEGKKTDYHSRFKLVFQCTGVDENTDDDATNVNFAFQHEDELIVNGEGFLQLFDVTGRCLMTADVHGEQSSLVLPPIATGVYLLRLSGDQVKVQKIIIQ